MTLINDKIKMISCSDFRLFLKKMIKDKIEKQWSESFVENLNFVMVSRNTIKRRYEDKGIDLIKLLNDVELNLPEEVVKAREYQYNTIK